MKDRDETDEKIIAIPFNDPQYNNIRSLEDMPNHIMDELRHFLSVYKQLEGKQVDVLETGFVEEAERTIELCKDRFEVTYGNKSNK